MREFRLYPPCWCELNTPDGLCLMTAERTVTDNSGRAVLVPCCARTLCGRVATMAEVYEAAFGPRGQRGSDADAH